MDVCSLARVRMCCSGVRATLLERRRYRAFVFYSGVCMFSSNNAGTWSKSNGPNVEDAPLRFASLRSGKGKINILACFWF